MLRGGVCEGNESWTSKTSLDCLEASGSRSLQSDKASGTEWRERDFPNGLPIRPVRFFP